jgi:hypothetical protein
MEEICNEVARVDNISAKHQKFEQEYNNSGLNQSICNIATELNYKYYGTTISDVSGSIHVNITFIKKSSESESISKYMNFFDAMYDLVKFKFKNIFTLKDIQVKYKTSDENLGMHFTLIFK